MPFTDPRVSDLVSTVNGKIYNSAVRHAIYVDRLAAGEAERVVAFLERKLFPDLMAKLGSRLAANAAAGYGVAGRAFDKGPWTTKRMAQMLSQLDDMIKGGFRGARAELVPRLVDIAKTEAEWMAKLLGSAAPVELGVGLPSAGLLRSIVVARPMQGKLLRDWFTDVSAATRRNVHQAIQLGLAEGETIDQITRRLTGTKALRYTDGILETSRRHARTITRTAVSHTTNHAKEALYDENQDIVKGVQWVSTLDGRTTVQCVALDGQVFDVGKGPRPPAHIQCRSATTPVLKSWKEMGINLKEAPPGTRASMNGQVPAKTTYADWLRQQDHTFQDGVLGKGRAKLFRDGMDPGKFVSARGKPLSLAQLRKMEGLPAL